MSKEPMSNVITVGLGSGGVGMGCCSGGSSSPGMMIVSGGS